MGLGPLLILVFLLVASLYAISQGLSLSELGARIGVVSVITGLIYLAWYELAKHNPQFAMGPAGESTIVLVVVAVALIFVSGQVATSVGLAVVPNYGTLQLVGGTSLDLANVQLGALFLVFGLIVLGVLVFLMLGRKSK
jgi:hypothetical protein